MSDRWQEDPVRGPRIRAWLDEIERFRIRYEAATALAAGTQDGWSKRRSESIAAGAVKGLDATIGMALVAKDQVPHDEIARAAGKDLAYVEAVLERLNRR